MRVAFINRERSETRGVSVDAPFVRLSRELASAGHEVVLYGIVLDTSYPKSEDAADRLRVVTWAIPSVGIRTFLSIFHAIVRGYDVVHSDSVFLTPYLILLRLFRRGTTLIMTIRKSDRTGLAGLASRLLSRVAVALVDRVVSPDSGFRGVLSNRPGEKIVRVPDGVDDVRRSDSGYHRVHGLREERYAVADTRGVDESSVRGLVKAFQDLVDTGSLPNNFKLAVIGSLAETYGFGRCLRTMDERQGSILFLGEPDTADTLGLLTHAAAFIQLSDASVSSESLLSAMSAGLPVIGEDGAGNREVLGTCGICFDGRQSGSLRSALAYLLNRPDEMTLYGKMSHDRIRNRYSWEAVARRMAELYMETVAGPCRECGVRSINNHA